MRASGESAAKLESKRTNFAGTTLGDYRSLRVRGEFQIMLKSDS